MVWRTQPALSALLTALQDCSAQWEQQLLTNNAAHIPHHIPRHCSSLWILTFEFVHFWHRWRKETTVQHFSPYKRNKGNIFQFFFPVELTSQNLNQWALSFFSQKYLEASKLLWKEKTKNKQTKPTKMQGRQTQETASSRGRERLVTKSSWAVPREILWLNPSYWPPSQGWAHCKAGHPLGNRNLCCAASLKPSWLLC